MTAAVVTAGIVAAVVWAAGFDRIVSQFQSRVTPPAVTAGPVARDAGSPAAAPPPRVHTRSGGGCPRSAGRVSSAGMGYSRTDVDASRVLAGHGEIGSRHGDIDSGTASAGGAACSGSSEVISHGVDSSATGGGAARARH